MVSSGGSSSVLSRDFSPIQARRARGLEERARPIVLGSKAYAVGAYEADVFEGGDRGREGYCLGLDPIY